MQNHLELCFCFRFARRGLNGQDGRPVLLVVVLVCDLMNVCALTEILEIPDVLEFLLKMKNVLTG